MKDLKTYTELHDQAKTLKDKSRSYFIVDHLKRTETSFDDIQNSLLKYKFTKDGIGDIKDQSMEMLGYSRIIENYGIKIGVGKLQQLGYDRNAIDFGFMYSKKLEQNLSFNFNNDYVSFSGGNANDLKTSLDYSLTKIFNISLNYYNLHNKMDVLKSNFNKTEVSLSYKF